uniref:J domain-containing protein n=1 Tax=Corethron hystrix TaxID=216773 RepID=A0A6U5H7Q2_9STRA|mmetsp:Transcript_29052/g.66518  ORF Transcript_29052/g.66518 Transcript_29052/m.66518 type:complete len:357 (+) Transcript_29052:252-1322(+)|eukprot:CAMPEP_0113299940 /NCGR_PEP_ID=MMETSP0010_2-20120614/1773_1 /TAXON_ID=216773 ORGANISM="Corethron hystrix, Strain 308" /NCGR_SAMPLE_ID=MMETSP0010_2 /ASSEMBLY_ACC=CAM_ASM_000155 /LENGTH=356 /DNA_ID=CAMNT_0000153273 /DNA_START=234 /DNA_END=1304 /DNA_ORIENTATION=- /assembly_acc=CAM_ASM_000155
MSESGENTPNGSSELDSLTSFFFYVFIVHPATAWFLKPGRFQKKQALAYAIGFLALLASVKTGMEWRDRGPNHYTLLRVDRNSSPLEIKRAYKKLSLELHPDKNPDPNAADQFHRVKSAYDVLMDMELRVVYNKYGDEGIRTNKRYSEYQMLLEVGIFYATWAMLVFVLTLGKKGNGNARQWIYTVQIMMIIAEVALYSSEKPLPEWFLPSITEAEIIWLLHTLFPAYMNGCRAIGAHLFVDLDAQTRQLLFALQEQNKDILLVLRDVQIGIQSLESKGVSSNSTGGGVITTSATRGPVPRITPTGKVKELQERLRSSNTKVAGVMKEIQGDGEKSSNLGFYAMIVGYCVLNYLFA